MLQTNYSRYKYTPDEMPQEEFLERFVVRNEIYEEIFKDIKTSNYKVANQHYIIIGQRGQGKTTLLRKLQIEVENDTKLSKFLLPVKFAEEQYQIRSLSRLWEEVADYLQSLHEELFPHVLDEMEEHFDDDDYELKAFSYLESALKKKKKKLLLLIDNIDELIGKFNEKEQRRLREILLTSSSFRIVGGSTKMLEQHYDYGKPFYEFFKIIKLKGFSKEESIAFLRSIGKGEQKERMEEIIKTNPARIETLRQLTGGVPRTLVMLFDIFLDEGGNAFDDLLKVLDEATPLYKHRIDELPNQLQELVHTIAINWDGMYTAEIAKKTRLSTKVISAQLGKLEKYDIIESEVAGKNKIYKIKERFFNIWYLMRFGRKKDRQRVEWLVRFLESWCTKEELDERAEKLIDKINDGDASESYVFNMTEALCYTGISDNLEHILKDTAKRYLKEHDNKLHNDVTSSYHEKFNRVNQFLQKSDYEKALQLLKNAYPSDKDNREFTELMLHFLEKLIACQNNENKEYLDEMRIVASTFINFINEHIDICELSRGYADNFIDKKSIDDELKVLENIDNEQNTIYKSLLYTWYEQFEVGESYFYKWLGINEFQSIIVPKMTLEYFAVLLAKEQYYQAKNILENKEFNLKEQFKPIWYALMTLMQDDFPYEIKKMGSELQESVDEVLKKVEKYRMKYGE